MGWKAWNHKFILLVIALLWLTLLSVSDVLPFMGEMGSAFALKDLSTLYGVRDRQTSYSVVMLVPPSPLIGHLLDIFVSTKDLWPDRQRSRWVAQPSRGAFTRCHHGNKKDDKDSSGKGKESAIVAPCQMSSSISADATG